MEGLAVFLAVLVLIISLWCKLTVLLPLSLQQWCWCRCDVAVLADMAVFPAVLIPAVRIVSLWCKLTVLLADLAVFPAVFIISLFFISLQLWCWTVLYPQIRLLWHSC